MVAGSVVARGCVNAFLVTGGRKEGFAISVNDYSTSWDFVRVSSEVNAGPDCIICRTR